MMTILKIAFAAFKVELVFAPSHWKKRRIEVHYCPAPLIFYLPV